MSRAAQRSPIVAPERTFSWRRRVGVRDVDALGIVWYGHYLGFCDEARGELLRSMGLPPKGFVTLGLMPVVAAVDARYLRPARFDDEVVIRAWVAEAHGTKLTFAFAIRDGADGTELAAIRTTMVMLDARGELIYLVPDAVAEPIARLLAEYGPVVDAPRS